MREDYRKLPADLYGSMKVGCEELGRYYRETYGIEFIALRFVSIYGPGKEARHGPLSFYGQLIEKAREGAKWVIPQGGDQLNDAVYVGDVGRSVYLALKAPTPKEWTFNIGTGKACTPRDFLNAAAKLFPNHKIELGPRAEQARQEQAELLHLRYLGGANAISATSRRTRSNKA